MSPPAATIGIFLLFAWLVVSLLWLAQRRLHLWFKKPTEMRLTARWILAVLCLLAAIGFLVALFGRLVRPVWLIPASWLTSTILVFFSDEVEEPPRWMRVAYVRLMRPFRLAHLRAPVRSVLYPFTLKGSKLLYGFQIQNLLYGFLLSVTCIAFFLWLGGYSFLKLPRELGGPSPSCVALDLKRTMLSGEAQRELLPDAGHGGNIVRTFPLDLMFAGGDSLLVRRRAAKPGETYPVYAIASRLIGSMIDCE